MEPHKRFQLAVIVINITNFLASLTKKVAKNTPVLLTGIVRLPSYVAIDVQPSEERVPSLNIDPTNLTHLVRERDSECLKQFGGVNEIVVLETDEDDGIKGNEADVMHRKNVFGSNTYKKPPGKTFLGFVLEAFENTTIVILLVCAILSLGFGIKEDGVKEGWYDGGSILFAIFLVISVSAVSNFKQSKQFEKLSSESSDIKVEVVRGGRRQPVSIFEVVVGDIVCLKIGDQIPVDGLFLDGHSLKVDESSMTGESDHVEINASENPFLLSGTKVTDGYGHMLVTAVGMNTAWGEMMSSVNRDFDAINFVAAVSSGNVPLTAVQLLWVNLRMDTLGALALATERPTDDLMKKPPVGRSEPLITRVMWRNLSAQACYQLTVLLTLQFKGRSIFGVTEKVKDTIIFNTFVLCQVFNEFNARNLETKNIVKGILKNKLFLVIVGMTVGLQVVMVELLKRFATTERLNWGQWAACVGIAAMSWPIGWLVKCIPV